MKYITDYKEFDGNPNRSILNYMSSTCIDKKDAILLYLCNGADDGVRCSSVRDYVTETLLPETTRLFTDGEYFWDSEEIYHFKEYNIPLNEDFILKVLKSNK